MADDEKRGTGNSMTDVRTVLLGEIAKIFEDTLGCAGDEIRRLYKENEALRRTGGAGGPVNVNYQGDITDADLQKRLVDLLTNVIDRVQNDPSFGQGSNFNIQIGAPKKRSSTPRKRSSTPRVTVKDLRAYVEQRADEIVDLIKKQPNTGYDDAALKK